MAKNINKAEPTLNNYQKFQLCNSIYELILQGKPKVEIMTAIIANTPKILTENEVQEVYEFALQSLEDNQDQDKQTVIAIHTIWYEELYAYFFSIGHTEGMLKAMKGKERLLGIHKPPTLKIDKRTNINVRVFVPSEYDLTKLTNEEQLLLEELLSEATVKE